MSANNMTTEMKNGKLVITLDINGTRFDSNSGKMELIGSTHGFSSSPDWVTNDKRQVKLSVNCGISK